jgi:alkyl sulfatase BDS1-like metallo-beta-lactamase superfamily hydrolase
MSDATKINAPKPAEPATARSNRAFAATLPLSDRQDFTDADRGFIATLPDATITDKGRAVWSLADYAFLKSDDVPDSVNPSLWRQAQLNYRHGLYEIVPGLYQIRGFDLSNMTIIEGDTGVIIVDPITAAQAARAGLELYYQHRSKRPVKAVIYTHSHTDHWGGVKGVLSQEEADAGTPVIAPEGFLDAIAQENILPGPAMARRGQYQFGPTLPKGILGQVDAGLGKTTTSGLVTLIAPNDYVRSDNEKRVIDGVEIIFLMAPNSEAPAEFHMFYPKYHALNMAENTVHNFHNLLPFRGAEVRDSLSWSRYIDVAIETFGEKVEVLLGQHHWPVWGNDHIGTYLRTQRDLYKYVHDQTLRLTNLGYTPNEIAETIELPKSICCAWHTRGYYGTARHNSKAVYQRYLGWYDANPANLDPLPPVEASKKYIEYMGGVDAAVAKAREDFKRGEYRFVAQVMNHVVFAHPDHADGRALAADTYEQLGYQAEAATWRNAYLLAAHELRNGPPKMASRRGGVPPDALRALPLGSFFDFWGVRLNGPKADGKRIVLNWRFTDTGEVVVLNLENSALTHREGKASPTADATVTLTRKALDRITLFESTFPQEIDGGNIKVEGDRARLDELLDLLETFDSSFPIVEPKAVHRK